MSMSNDLETGLLLLLFNNDVPTGQILDDVSNGIGESAADGSLYVSLHDDDPGEAGDQTTNEVGDSWYSRKAVARTTGGFTVSGNTVTNAADIDFDQADTSGSVTHVGIGTDASGAGNLLGSAPLGGSPSLFIGTTDDNITIPGHSFSVNDRITFQTADPGQALPTGITEGTIYWVKTVASDVITISTTQGGATLDITATGAGYARSSLQLDYANLVTPRFLAGTLSWTFD
jgi:hypothetical protein